MIDSRTSPRVGARLRGVRFLRRRLLRGEAISAFLKCCTASFNFDGQPVRLPELLCSAAKRTVNSSPPSQHAPKNRRGAILSPVRLAGSYQAGLTSYSRWDYWFS